MKTEFELEVGRGGEMVTVDGKVEIIGARPSDIPYVVINVVGYELLFFKDRDLERFAVNILKALKSKKLK